MTAETLGLLTGDTEVAGPALSGDSLDPSDLGQQENETPEEMIARGEIPEGYTRDAKTKEIRRKKTRGRPRLGTSAPRPDTPIDRKPDESPDSKVKGHREAPIPRYQKGVIAAGMTKLYKRAGRLVKAMDKDIGVAIIESAEDCGEAWDELARTNPRIRRTLMKMISGGAWGSVIMAHLPILLAIIMKDGIRKHIPFMKLIDSMMADDEEGPSEMSSMLGGMTQQDMRQAMAMAQSMMGGVAMKAAQNGGNE